MVMEGPGGLATDNDEIGELVVTMPPKPAGRDKITVTFKIDQNHNLTCTAVDKNTGKSNKLEVEWGNVLNLTEEELEEARERVDQF